MTGIVYQATHKVTGNEYIGVTRKGLEARKAQHLWKAKTSPKTHFHLALAKYGESAFEFVAIATCISSDELGALERDLISDRRPHYNQTSGGEATKGRRIPREVSERIRLANTGKRRTAEQRKRNSEIKLQQIASDPVYRAKVMASIARAVKCIDRDRQRAAASKTSRDRVWSDESRAKLRAASIERETKRATRKLVECESLACVFDSITEAASLLNLSRGNISRVCRTGGTTGGLRFRLLAQPKTP